MHSQTDFQEFWSASASSSMGRWWMILGSVVGDRMVGLSSGAEVVKIGVVEGASPCPLNEFPVYSY